MGITSARSRSFEKIDQHGYLRVDGDATQESALKAAGIERAATIAVVIPSDAVKVFLTLSARTLDTDLEMTGSSAFLIVKIIRADGQKIHRPGLETKILAGDTMLMLCHRGSRLAFDGLFSDGHSD